MVSKKEIEIIMEEKFKAQEVSLLKIISGNTKIQTDKLDKVLQSIGIITKRIELVEEKQKSINTTVEELKKSLEFTQDTLINEKLSLLDKELKKFFNAEFSNMAKQTLQIQSMLDEVNILGNELKEKSRQLEDRNRRNNLRIDGIYESERETWAEAEQKVQKIFCEQLKINNVVIERAHRIGTRSNLKDTKDKPRTIVLKLLNYKDKENILKNAKMLKGKGIYINEDFSEHTNQIRRSLMERMMKERKDGKYAVIVYDKLVVKEFNRKSNQV